MKKKTSLSFQLVFTMLILVIGVVGIFWIMNNTLLEKYYVYSKEKEMLSVYDMVNRAAVDDDLSDSQFNLSLKKKCARGNIDVVVFNKYGKVVIEGPADSQEIMGLLFEAGLYKYSAEYNSKKIIRQRDSNLGTDYIIINTLLADGNYIYMKTPIESIRESVNVSNQFFLIGGFVAVIIGIIVIVFLARNLSRPIRSLSNLSMRMAALDFEAEYIHTKHGAREIDELGEHMNELSGALEHTISELKIANNELKRDIKKKEEIDEMRKEFLSNVSHELKTPLALISGYAEGLKDAVNDDEESRNFYCEVIMDETDKMNRMVMKLLSLNKLEFGKDTVEIERFDITEVIAGVINSSSLMAAQNDINIVFDDSRHEYVWGDVFKIEEVLTNYISNAINHCTRGGTITVSYSMYSDRVRVSVFNTGEPIPDKDIENIWNKFYKVDKARTREYGGSGIGLSIVKAIMELHDQKCGVINREDGVEFWFELELCIVNS